MRDPDPDEQLARILGWTPADRVDYRDGPDEWPGELEYDWTGSEFWEQPPG
jgi:hypothetical protein